MYQLGMWEMMVVLVLILLLFGAKRLPEVGKSLGQGIKEFKKSLTVATEEEEEEKTDSAKIEENKDAPLNKHHTA